MSVSVNDKNIGHVTAYAYAKAKGYTGTEEEFAQLMADYGSVAQAAAQSASEAAQSAQDAAGSSTDAQAAKTAAETARTDAQAARDGAQTAEAGAQAAKTAAETAQSRAESARSGAETARTQAAGLAEAASTSATNASASETAAAASATAAQTAQTGAETAKTAAETAQENAESSAESIAKSVAQIATNTQNIAQLQTDTNTLKEDIQDSIGTTDTSIPLTTSAGYVRADGTINTSASSYKHTQNIPCDGVINFKYTGNANGSGMYVAVFFDASDNAIGTFGRGTSPATSHTDTLVSVPAGAAYVVFTSEGNGAFIVKQTTLTPVRTDINNIWTTINTGKQYYSKKIVRLCSENVSDGYVKADGTINSNNTWKHTEWIPVAGISNIIYTGYAFYGTPYCVVFRDANQNVVGAYLTGNSSDPISYVNEVIQIPNNAYDVAFTWYNIKRYPDGNAKYDLQTEITITSLKYPYEGKKWVCMGDSLTAINNSALEKYHAVIAEELGFSVVNMGDGGTGYKKGYDTNRAFYQRIASCPTDADIVTVFGSGNDLNYYSALGDYTDTGTDTICGCVNTFLDNYFEICPTTPIGIIAPTPWLNYPTTTPGNHMELYADKLKQIAEYRGVPFLDLYHNSSLRPENQTNRSLCFYSGTLDGNGDGVHPNNLGHKIIASKIREFVKTLI